MKEFLGHGPISEQLKNFAQASLIVAPHGAGLSNVMVSPLHTPVLEIAPPSCSICYIHLAVKVLALCGAMIRVRRTGIQTCHSSSIKN